ncbi:MAG TPA: hemerythrin domain-containing protein [Cyclobacteriaceae bacterium]|nr:hemerythrin domain-containing protein [Cyclobacteriaceae bacterium]
MNRPPPIKRIEELVPLSHDHHHALWLCLKIRAGFKKGVDIERIKKYAACFFKKELLPHFELEEGFVFPVLGTEHELVRRALREHRKLKRLFNSKSNIKKNLVLIEEQLEGHIRFEERVLFREIQRIATPEQLRSIAVNHQMAAISDELEYWNDKFWL